MIQVVNVTNYANLRLDADANSTLVTTIPKGTILPVLNYYNGWYQINYNGQIAWIYGNLVATAPAGKYVTVNGVYQLNIRSSASSYSSILGTITDGQYAYVLGYNSDGTWTNISLNGITGWCSNKYLK